MEQGSKFSVSEVLDSFGMSKFTWKIIVMLGIAMFFTGYNFMVVNFTMPVMRVQWGLDNVAAGSIQSFSLIGMIFGGTIGGIISDKLGRKTMLITAVSVTSLATLVQSFAPGFEFFGICRLFVGFGIGAAIPVIMTATAELAPAKNRGIAITLGTAWMVLGWVFSGIFAGFVSNNGWIPVPAGVTEGIGSTVGVYANYIIPGFENWRICFLVGAIPLVYAIILFFIMKETPAWYVMRGRREDAVRRLAEIEKSARGTVTDRNPAELIIPEKIKGASPLTLFKKKYVLTTIGLWLSFFFAQFAMYGVTAWLPQWLGSEQMMFGAAVGAVLASMNNAAGILSNLVGGNLSDKIGRKKNLIVGWIVAIISIVPIVLFVVPGASFILTLVLMVFFGFALNLAICAINPILPECYPTEVRNTGVSWAQAFSRLGGIVAPMILGVILTRNTVAGVANWNMTFLTLLIPLVLGLICTTVFIRSDKKAEKNLG